MYYNYLIKIPENTGKISKNKRGTTTYIEFTYGRKYNPEMKYNVPQRTTIGKMSSEDDRQLEQNSMPTMKKIVTFICTIVQAEKMQSLLS